MTNEKKPFDGKKAFNELWGAVEKDLTTQYKENLKMNDEKSECTGVTSICTGVQNINYRHLFLAAAILMMKADEYEAIALSHSNNEYSKKASALKQISESLMNL